MTMYSHTCIEGRKTYKLHDVVSHSLMSNNNSHSVLA